MSASWGRQKKVAAEYGVNFFYRFFPGPCRLVPSVTPQTISQFLRCRRLEICKNKFDTRKCVHSLSDKIGPVRRVAKKILKFCSSGALKFSLRIPYLFLRSRSCRLVSKIFCQSIFSIFSIFDFWHYKKSAVRNNAQTPPGPDLGYLIFLKKNRFFKSYFSEKRTFFGGTPKKWVKSAKFSENDTFFQQIS